MTIVYCTGTRSARFHSNPDCWRLKGRQQTEVQAFDISEMLTRKPCRECWPEQPKMPRVRHQPCKICRHRQPLPCRHGGAIKVFDGHTASWVWPENVLRYPLDVTLAKSHPAH